MKTDSIEIKNIEDVEIGEDLDEKISVIVTLSNNLIDQLQLISQTRFGDTKHINGIIENKLRDLCIEKKLKAQITYKGKTKIRFDVLKKFRGITELMRHTNTYPKFKRQQLNQILTDILGNCDTRVKDNFIESINRCVYYATGKKPSLYDLVDCTSFIDAVNQKFQDLDR